jgi:cytochrome c-type biogenesis protein CcmH
MVIAVAVPLTAFGLYLELGTPAALDGVETVQAAPASAPGGVDQGQVPHSLEEMVSGLEARLAETPNDPQGWVMLGRSYAAMKRPEDARDALAEASRLQPDDPFTLVAYAEVLGGLQDNGLAGKPIELIRRALELQPEFPRALWLAGVEAFRREDRPQALIYWQRLADGGTLDPEDAQRLGEAIAAVSPGAPGLAQAAPRPTAASTASASAAPTPAATADASGGLVRVSVDLSPQLAEQAAPTDTVFVFARAAQGPRMPLAVQRRTVADLPLTVTLDDSMAMTPQFRLSSFPQVVVGARVSKSGNAAPSAGDLSGLSEAVNPTAGVAVSVMIDGVVP